MADAAATDAPVLIHTEEAAATAVLVEEEVVFMPFYSYSASSSSSTRQGSCEPRGSSLEPAISYMVVKAAPGDLAMQLPPPVGLSSARQQPSSSLQPDITGGGKDSRGSSNNGVLLKVGAGTDVNMLSNAIIRCILNEQGHAKMQLAGAAACHVAMKALIKAHFRLQHKFDLDIVAAAGFMDDSSNGVRAKNVFLQLDIFKCNLLRHHPVNMVAQPSSSPGAPRSAPRSSRRGSSCHRC